MEHSDMKDKRIQYSTKMDQRGKTPDRQKKKKSHGMFTLMQAFYALNLP
jgi:hypothetical protein